MNIPRIVSAQYKAKVGAAFKHFGSAPGMPPEGWLRTVRKALGMSGPQLANRLDVTRARVSKMERDEPLGNVTLKSMHAAAEAMNCRFVYAVVPMREIDDMIEARAMMLATKRVKASAAQMAMEDQSPERGHLKDETERLARQMIDDMPADFWNVNE